MLHTSSSVLTRIYNTDAFFFLSGKSALHPSSVFHPPHFHSLFFATSAGNSTAHIGSGIKARRTRTAEGWPGSAGRVTATRRQAAWGMVRLCLVLRRAEHSGTCRASHSSLRQSDDATQAFRSWCAHECTESRDCRACPSPSSSSMFFYQIRAWYCCR